MYAGLTSVLLLVTALYLMKSLLLMAVAILDLCSGALHLHIVDARRDARPRLASRSGWTASPHRQEEEDRASVVS